MCGVLTGPPHGVRPGELLIAAAVEYVGLNSIFSVNTRTGYGTKDD